MLSSAKSMPVHAVASISNHKSTAKLLGAFTNSEHGTVTISSTKDHSIVFERKGNPIMECPDLNGILARWGDNKLAISELPLLGYVDYENPVIVFEFEVDEGGIAIGFFVQMCPDDEAICEFTCFAGVSADPCAAVKASSTSATATLGPPPYWPAGIAYPPPGYPNAFPYPPLRLALFRRVVAAKNGTEVVRPESQQSLLARQSGNGMD
ncbi:UNVERIFIED_CONTAM: hypothetical protein HDU68_012639 [Siphonaria sp. JEL0065]|nr:hypothetical protein HDU68_012639 [Siphonaria sp. JEL0065]